MAPDMSYKEMTLHCEALLTGKQQKMSHLMSTQQRQESLMIFDSQNQNDEVKKSMFDSHVEVRFNAVLPSPENLY